MATLSDADRLVLANGLILADPARPVTVPHGRTVISGDMLAQVNVPRDDEALHGKILDCSGCLIMPGLVNAHTHGAMSLLRGVADDLPLDTWLNKYIFPAEAKHAGPDFVHLGTALSAVEMALGGITTFADGYFHMEMSARAAVEVGLRGVIAQGILDVPAPDAATPGSWLDRARAFFDGFPHDPLVHPALFCHSPYLCGPETLQRARDLARRLDALLFSHVSETRWETDEIKRRYGSRPVEHLNNLGILGKGFVAVHGVHLADKEMELLAESGTAVVHCPESNMKLASGAAPVQKLLDRGITVALGTDGPASNNNLDLFEEMRSASLMAKLISSDPEALSAGALLRTATIDAARALGMDDRIGSLAPGKLADVIVVDLDRPHLTPMYDPLSHIVYAARASDVKHVIVNGRIIVENHRIKTVDDRDIKQRARAFASALCKDLGIETDFGALLNHDRQDYV